MRDRGVRTARGPIRNGADVTIKQSLYSQGRKPTGALGWIIAWIMPVIFRSLYAKVARLLNLQTEDDVLDVACGSGAFLKGHASHVRCITGLDHSAVEISLAKRSNRGRIAAGTAEFVQGDSAALPWPDNRFTAVTCNCVSCFAEPQLSLAEMRRVLRPGGRAVIVMDARRKEGENRSMETDKAGIQFWAWTEDEVRQMMADAGFSQVSLSYDMKMWFAEALKQ